MATFIDAASGVNTATMPAHQAGDKIVLFAFRDGSTTAPAIPAGQDWVNKGSGGVGTVAYRLVEKDAADSSEAVGTFTNATGVIVAVYRPGAGETLTLGALAVTAANSATMVYPAVTLEEAGGSSWGLIFGGTRFINGTLETAPTGGPTWTLRETYVDGENELVLFDTNGGISTFASSTRATGGSIQAGETLGTYAVSLELKVAGSSGYTLAAETAAFAIATPDVGLRRTARLLAEVSAFAIAAQDAGLAPGTVPTVTWNPSDTDGGIAFSNGDLTATQTSGTAVVRSTVAIAGKEYVEVTIGGTTAQALGFLLAGATITDFSGTPGAVYYHTTLGQLHHGVDGSTSIGTAGDGDVLCLAIDWPNQLLWARINGGDYNGSATADPDTGAEGFDFSAWYDPGDDARYWAYIPGAGDSATLNAGATAFAFTKPATFAGPDEAGGGSYTLTADAAALAIAAQDAALEVGRRLPAEVAALSIAGQAAALQVGRRIAIEAGGFALAAQDANLLAGRRLAADAGAYAVASQDAGLRITRRIVLEVAAYSIAAQDAGLRKGRSMAADAAAVALDALDVGFIYHRRLKPEVAAYGLEAQPAGLLRGFRLAADAAALQIAAQAAGIVYGRRLGTEAAGFALAAQAAALRVGRALGAETGAIAIAAIDATFARTYRIAAAVRAFAISAKSAGLVYESDKVIVADAAEFAIDAQVAALRRSRRIAAEVAEYAASAQGAALRAQRRVSAAVASLEVASPPVALSYGRRIAAQVAALALDAQAAGLRVDRRLAADGASFALATPTVYLVWSAEFILPPPLGRRLVIVREDRALRIEREERLLRIAREARSLGGGYAGE